ncbi:MAG: flagellar biosynthesis protein FliQ [Chthonomonas sp.]|nr:flagellar biosynthesis protein FliQ [Chthonomonas sp.]
MNEGVVLELTRQGMIVAMMVSLPILAVSLFVGLSVSIFQAVTQVQEMTLTYVPKLMLAGVALALSGGWMLSTLVGFMKLCFNQASRVQM